jgi:Fic family protein
LARPAIRREAVSTSALEGTYAALDDVLEADFLEAGEVSAPVAEVVNYVRADRDGVCVDQGAASPPGDRLTAGFEAWEAWINARDDFPLIVKMALGHYQFETLHPFNDGNGRLGRLICVLQLAREGELRVPVLDISPWLEVRRREYQDHLLRVSMTGRFDTWIRFFSEAVRAQAVLALERIDALLD